jgi:hypothetical protein
VVFVVTSFFAFSDFTDLGFFSPHFSHVCHGWSILFIFSENHLFLSLILCTFFCLFVSISLNSALILIISFLLLAMGFVCSYFSRSLSCSIRSLIWNHSVFLIYALMAINFPLRTAFAVSHRFW